MWEDGDSLVLDGFGSLCPKMETAWFWVVLEVWDRSNCGARWLRLQTARSTRKLDRNVPSEAKQFWSSGLEGVVSADAQRRRCSESPVEGACWSGRASGRPESQLSGYVM